jgi:hypothetical protein
MGFIRGAAITLFSIVLLISLFLMNLSLTVSWSLEHDTLQSALNVSAGDFLKNSLGAEKVFGEETKAYMKSYCLVNNEYNFTYEKYIITIPCNVVAKGTDSMINYGIANLMDSVYYDKYDCEFWTCVKDSQVPLVLFSEKAMDYWRSKFILLALISFALFALTFLISTKKSVTLIVTGILLILSSLPFRSLNWALKVIPKQFSGIFSVFFTRAHSVFLIILIIGIIFIGIGFVFRFFGWSLSFGNFLAKESDKEEISKSEVREIVDEEISKKNSVKPKQKKK